MVMNDHARIHSSKVEAAGECLTARGGGVYNTGRLVMRDHSAIHANELGAGDDCSSPEWGPGDAQGGGVYNTGSLIMRDQAGIAGNGPTNDNWTELQGGGIYNAMGGTLSGVLCGAGGNVYGNTPDDCYFAE